MHQETISQISTPHKVANQATEIQTSTPPRFIRSPLPADLAWVCTTHALICVNFSWHSFTKNWREFTSHWPRIARPRSANVFCSGLFCYARSKERKPNLNYQFSHEEVTLLRLALGIALRQFEDCLDGEAPQMLTYINQPSWSEASQAARAMIEQLSIPGVVVTISAQARTRN
jgi:hypothetical protein